MYSCLVRRAQRALICFGALVLAYAGAVAVYAGVYQRYQSWKFGEAITRIGAAPAAGTAEVIDPPEGALVGKLEIPRIGVSVMVLQGIESRTLIAGAGRLPGGPRPGAEGNVVIAAHRDTFFRNLEGIAPGDRILMTTLSGTYAYIVGATNIVDPEDAEVLLSGNSHELTLITCYPFYFIGPAPKRFVVHAREVE
ncbi:MAG TPA: class D sortase [Terriglobia bacterium]|nr:class D sortase [Terriglobia bacterium]